MSKLLQRRLKYVDYLWKHVLSILTIPAPLPLVTFREKPQIVNYKKIYCQESVPDYEMSYRAI